MTQDDEQIRLLSIFHCVVAGMAGLFSMFPIFHLAFGIFLIVAPQKFSGNGEPPPAFLGWFLVIFAAVFIILGLTFATFVLVNGRFLAKRKHHRFCLVMSCVECIFMPFGTVLGTFSILVLSRESVKKQFLPCPDGCMPRQAGEPAPPPA